MGACGLKSSETRVRPHQQEQLLSESLDVILQLLLLHLPLGLAHITAQVLLQVPRVAVRLQQQHPQLVQAPEDKVVVTYILHVVLKKATNLPGPHVQRRVR